MINFEKIKQEKCQPSFFKKTCPAPSTFFRNQTGMPLSIAQLIAVLVLEKRLRLSASILVTEFCEWSMFALIYISLTVNIS